MFITRSQVRGAVAVALAAVGFAAAPAAAGADESADGLHAFCNQRTVQVIAPHLRAAQQGGQVAFQPIILVWDGQAWQRAAEYSAYVSAGDAATIWDEPFADASWYAFDTGAPAGGWTFNINQSGFYAVVDREWWTENGQWAEGAGQVAWHEINSVFNDDTSYGSYCYIP